jgi:mRNA interferase MazF
MNNNGQIIKRGDVWLADLGTPNGSEQGGTRPVVVIQNNIGNRYSPTVIVVAVTGQLQKAKLPTHVELKAELHNLDRDSVGLGEQIRTIDKNRLKYKVTTLDERTTQSIFEAVVFGIADDEYVMSRRKRQLIYA